MKREGREKISKKKELKTEERKGKRWKGSLKDRKKKLGKSYEKVEKPWKGKK